MNRITQTSSPVIIGSIGGSGTRVVTKIVSNLGFYLGSDVNKANDNLWFTLLFKRPEWYRQIPTNDKELFRGLSLLSKAMIGRQLPSLAELTVLLTATYDMATADKDVGVGRKLWPLLHAFRLLSATVRASPSHDHQHFTGWGWKEPNSHIYAEYFGKYFKTFKYIHTIRHGADMAFSSNQNQLQMWGPYYDVEVPDSTDAIPKASLKFWARANNKAYSVGQHLGPDKFLAVNFDNLCVCPEVEIDKIIDFLGVNPDSHQRDQLLQIPNVPESLGRYRNHDLNQFDDIDLEAVRSFGFSLR